MRRLEVEIGGALLTRTSRRVELTPVGEAQLEDARAGVAVGVWLRAKRPAVYYELGRDFTGEDVPAAVAPRDPGELVVA